MKKKIYHKSFQRMCCNNVLLLLLLLLLLSLYHYYVHKTICLFRFSWAFLEGWSPIKPLNDVRLDVKSFLTILLIPLAAQIFNTKTTNWFQRKKAFWNEHQKNVLIRMHCNDFVKLSHLLYFWENWKELHCLLLFNCTFENENE